ncbi:MAG: hypothetical protein WBQ17_15390 [Rhizomicrobium sp.]|jgi:hypothetical protein
MIANPVVEWRDFYVMIGTAAGVIVGATFVVATLAGGIEKRAIGLRGFITPNAVHLGVVLVGSAILAAPNIPSQFFDVVFGLGGWAGIVYCLVVVKRIWRMPLDFPDICFYIALPILSYAAFVAAAWWDWKYGDGAVPLRTLACAFVTLLIVGMRNSWDMATFMLLRGPGQK